MKKSYLFLIPLSLLIAGACVFFIVNNFKSSNNNTNISRISTNTIISDFKHF